MKRRAPVSPGMSTAAVQAFAALYGPPLSDEERADFRRQIIDRKARDEQARAGDQQLPLEPAKP